MAALCSLFMLLMVIIVVRLFVLQIVQFSFFSELAHGQYTFLLTSRPQRGTIFDRNKVPVALSNHTPSVFTTPSNLKERESLEKLVEHEFPTALPRLLANSTAHFCWLERDITAERCAHLKGLNHPDLFFIEEPHRFYPFPSLAPLVGDVDIDNVGISGLELLYDDTLHSTLRTVEIKRDARQQSALYFDRTIIEPGAPGNDLKLTIDSVLQQLVHTELVNTIASFSAKEGAVLIVNPDNGEILVMDSYSTDTTAPLRNIPVVDCFEPGSVAKAFVTLASLTEHVVTPDEVIDCEGIGTYINGFRVTNWHPFHLMSFTNALRNSSNVALARVALRLGPKLYNYYQLLGFGNKTNIEFPGERSGYINPPTKWTKGSNMVLSFGYEMSVTLLQLAKALCTLANNGEPVSPTLLPAEHAGITKKTVPGHQGPTITYTTTAEAALTLTTTCTINHWEETKEILRGIGEHYPIEGFATFGKTGTARCIKDGGYSNRAHVYTFIGLVERGAYRRVIITFVREPAQAHWYAAAVTAPLFARIGTIMTRHDVIMGANV